MALSIHLQVPASVVRTVSAIDRVLMLGASAVFLALLGTADARADVEMPWLPHVRLAAQEAGLQLDPDLLEATGLDVAPFEAEALVVRVLGTAPPPEFLLIQAESKWHVLMVQKQLTRDWWRPVESIVRHATRASPHELAEALTLLLVDPDPRFGRVIGRWEEIPLGDELSNYFRDLRGRRQESSLSDAVNASAAAHGPLHAPRVVGDRVDARFVFFTWDHFGGEVVRWSVRFDSTPCISRESLTSRLGSYEPHYS